MEPERVRGGSHGRVAPAHAAGSTSPYPPDVAKALSYLANLIDSTISLRGTGIGVRDFAAAFLSVPTTGVVATTCELQTVEYLLAAVAFAEDLEAHPPAAVIGEDMEESPRWQVLELGDLRVRIPLQLAAAFAPGILAPCGLIVSVDEGYEAGTFVFTVYCRSEDSGRARTYIDDLVARGRRRTNPFKGRILEATFHRRFGLSFEAARLDRTHRQDVILPAALWQELDRNVHGFFLALPRLKETGLARNRGILLEGPPGTGKTAICRVLAQELPGVTVVFCDAAAVENSVAMLYRQLVHLAPALVVMEDLDLVIGDRRAGVGRALNDFLLALDGAMSSHEGVVTIATTNEIRAIDPAAVRSARFDRVLSVPLPNRGARSAILRRYLSSVPHDDDDVEHVAWMTEGASGADLRDIVSQALIRQSDGEKLSTGLLVAVSRQKRAGGGDGAYL